MHDEYGHFDGLVTPADILDAIAGAFHAEQAKPDAVARADGSWLIAGSMPADEMAERLGLRLPPQRGYETAAGLVIAALRRLPETGEACELAGWRFEVVDLDGRRVDRILATRLGEDRCSTRSRPDLIGEAVRGRPRGGIDRAAIDGSGHPGTDLYISGSHPYGRL